MKCQSDFDNADQAILRQADECVEEWWNPDDRSSEATRTAGDTRERGGATAESEAIRRGLLRREEDGGLCVSCSEHKDETAVR